MTREFALTIGHMMNTAEDKKHGSEAQSIVVGPTVTKAGMGYRWVARTPHSNRPALAVFGFSEGEATRRLSASLARWADLLSDERPVGESAPGHSPD